MFFVCANHALGLNGVVFAFAIVLVRVFTVCEHVAIYVTYGRNGLRSSVAMMSLPSTQSRIGGTSIASRARVMPVLNHALVPVTVTERRRLAHRMSGSLPNFHLAFLVSARKKSIRSTRWSACWTTRARLPTQPKPNGKNRTTLC